MLALRLAVGLSRETERRDIITLAVGQWATMAPEAAAVWADGLEDPQLRSRAFAAVIAAWTEKSPSAAATLALDGLAAGAEREAALLDVMQRWAQVAPDGAAAWLGKLPDGDLRGRALPVLVETWASRDALQCGEWLNRLPDGPERDVAAKAYSHQVAPSSGAVAAQWAESIGDRTMRERALTDVARTWIGRDADAAEPWLRGAAIPEAVKARLLALRHEASPGGQ